MAGLLNVAYFLIALFFSLTIFMLWVRIALHYYLVSSLNKFAQMIHTMTHPLTKPFDYLCRLKTKRFLVYDWPAMIVLCIVEILKFLLLGLLQYGIILPLSYIGWLVIADFIIQPCQFLFYAIIFRVLVTWIGPIRPNPIMDALCVITNPILSLSYRISPKMPGIDISPFIAMLLLKMITLFVGSYLPMNI